MGKVTIFFKEDCGHCKRAKELLAAKHVPYEGIDIANNEPQRLLMVHLSARQTVPQIFFNEQHIGGASELLALEEKKVLDQRLEEVFAAPTPANFPPQDIPDQVLAETELPLGKVLDKFSVDITKDPQFEPIIPIFQQQFGFMPNTFKYGAIWPEAFIAWSCAHLTLWNSALPILGDFLTVAGFATSNAADCSYCAAHATQLSIDVGVNPEKLMKLHEFYREPNSADDSVLPFTPFERALIRISRAATLNRVTQEDLETSRSLDPEKAERSIEAIAAIAACYGFLNRFNDLIGTEVEGSINKVAKTELGKYWDMGKHETQDTGEADPYSSTPFSSSIDQSKPQSLQTFMNKNVASVGKDVKTYLQKELGFVPRWIQQIPFEDTRKAVARFYVGVTEDSAVSSELKHLMNRVVTKENGHRYLSHLESFMANRAAIRGGMITEKSLQRIKACMDVAKGKNDEDECFDSKERAALRLALASSTLPPFTPYSLISSLQTHFTLRQIVELVMSLCVCSLSQRWTAVMQPAIEQEVTEFLLNTQLESYPES